jgi:hypothetical protein
VKTLTAQVGTLTIGSINGAGGTVIESGGGVLDVFNSLTVEANGTLKSLSGPAVFILNGGNVTNFGVISGQAGGVIFTAGGNLLNEAGGSIITTTGPAISVESGNATIANLGTITGGDGVAINTTPSSGDTSISNIGTINGSVELGA